MSLLVQTRGVDCPEEHLEQELQIDHCIVILYAHGLGIARRVGINLFVCRVGGMSVGKTHLGVHHPFYLLEVMLGAPEAATSKENVSCHILHLSEFIVLRSCDDFVLQLLRHVVEVVGVARHADEQVFVVIRLLLGIEQGLRIDDVELDVMSSH